LPTLERTVAVPVALQIRFEAELDAECFRFPLRTVNMFLAPNPVVWLRRKGAYTLHETYCSLTSGRHRADSKRDPFLYVEVSGDGDDVWRLQNVFELLRDPSRGVVGILPTDTSYAFVCNLHSRTGVERIYSLKKTPPSVRKPLSLLCRNHAAIQRYALVLDKRTFKVLKALLPGPYTFILPATHEVPRVMIENRVHRKMWKRREIGVRWPRDPYCQAAMDALDGVALLASSVPDDEVEEDGVDRDYLRMLEHWEHEVDFMINAGARTIGLKSTVVDVTRGWRVLREGLGYEELRQVLGRELGAEILMDAPEDRPPIPE
jgi:tRNA threonylcarbamoyl adenosine modification protein (Sua5/YciO/YrdC/YwlC family)